MSESSPSPESGNRPAELHAMDLELIHTGDIARVTATDTVLDPAAVIAVWPYYQADFDDPSHAGDVRTTRGARKDMTVEDPVWEPDIKHSFHGVRATFATEDGGRYAVVDWGGTDGPPFLYLLVIGSVTLFPLIWTVERGRHSWNMERLHLTTAFHALGRAREVMSTTDGGSSGPVCLFCGRDGFATEGELDEHIDGHPYTVRRGEDGG